MKRISDYLTLINAKILYVITLITEYYLKIIQYFRDSIQTLFGILVTIDYYLNT